MIDHLFTTALRLWLRHAGYRSVSSHKLGVSYHMAFTVYSVSHSSAYRYSK